MAVFLFPQPSGPLSGTDSEHDRPGLTVPWWATLFGAAATATSAVIAGGIAELYWAGHRRLPELPNLDASGTIEPNSASGSPRSADGALKVVALGDSTLTGPGLVDPEQIWLQVALRRIPHDRPVRLVSLAAGGARVAGAAARVDEAVSLEPDMAVVAVGSNDVIRGVAPQQLAARLAVVVVRLLETVPVVAVANVGDLGNVARFPPPLNEWLRRRSQWSSRAVEAMVADRDRVALLDVTPSNGAFRDRDMFAADLFHPTSAGHLRWAEAAQPGLQAAFDRMTRTEPSLAARPPTTAESATGAPSATPRRTCPS